ncbi:MAG: hypothetical protein E7214_06080 [Clostridium sp.]|nr:hypothetical protein [Clostridium sp.]
MQVNEKSKNKSLGDEGKHNTELLERYFDLFDKSIVDKESRDNLINLFSEDMSFVLNGYKKDGTVYTQVGIDVAELDEFGKIRYLENVPDDSKLFNSYK